MKLRTRQNRTRGKDIAKPKPKQKYNAETIAKMKMGYLNEQLTIEAIQVW
jgi:hypothetical protein